MAYSPVPQQETRQFGFVPAAGSLSVNDQITPTTGNFDGAGRFVNCAPVQMPITGQDPEWWVVPRPTYNGANPDTQDLVTSTTEEVRGTFQVDDELWAVVGDDIYYGAQLTLIAPVVTGGLSYTTGAVTFAATPDYIIMLENHLTAARIHKVDRATRTITSTTSFAFGVHCNPIYLDGYIFINSLGQGQSAFTGPTEQRIYNSTLADPVAFTTGTDFLDAEQYTDQLICLAAHKNHIVALGGRSIEFFYNAANAIGSPLTRNTSYASQIGLVQRTGVTRRSILQTINDEIYFLGRGVTNAVGVYRIRDFSVEKVSTPYVDSLINGAFTAGVTVQSSIELGRMDAYGSDCLLISGLFTSDTYPSNPLLFNPISGVWSLIEFPSSITNTGATGIYNFNSIIYSYASQYGGTSFLYRRLISGSTYEYGFATFSDRMDASTIEDMEARFSTPMIDFDNPYLKSFNSIDVIGHFRSDGTASSTLQLDRTNDMSANSYVSGSIKSSTLLSNSIPRWHNFGRHRRLILRLKISGTSYFKIKGFMIGYTQGVQ